MKTKIFLIALIGGSFLFHTCKKYPDGPGLSMRSKTERLSNSWRIDQYFENGTDKTDDTHAILNGYNLIIDDNGTYSLYYKAFSLVDYNETGTWEFSEFKEAVHFEQTSPGSAHSEWTILRLKEKELWGTYQDSTNTVEVHMLPE